MNGSNGLVLEVVLHGDLQHPTAELRACKASRTVAAGQDVFLTCSQTVTQNILSRSVRANWPAVTEGGCAALIVKTNGVVSAILKRIQWVIQEVEARGAELYILPLGNVERLEHCQIAVEIRGTMNVGKL